MPRWHSFMVCFISRLFWFLFSWREQNGDTERKLGGSEQFAFWPNEGKSISLKKRSVFLQIFKLSIKCTEWTLCSPNFEPCRHIAQQTKISLLFKAYLSLISYYPSIHWVKPGFAMYIMTSNLNWQLGRQAWALNYEPLFTHLISHHPDHHPTWTLLVIVLH